MNKISVHVFDGFEVKSNQHTKLASADPVKDLGFVTVKELSILLQQLANLSVAPSLKALTAEVKKLNHKVLILCVRDVEDPNATHVWLSAQDALQFNDIEDVDACTTTGRFNTPPKFGQP